MGRQWFWVLLPKQKDLGCRAETRHSRFSPIINRKFIGMTTQAGSLNDLLRFFQVLLQVAHERRAAGAHGGGIAGLCFAVLMNIRRGIIQMGGPKACKSCTHS